MLSPGSEMSYKGREEMLEMILPVSGAVSYQDAETRFKPVASEEVLLAGSRKDYSLQNPYSNSLVNYLQIGLRSKRVFPEMTVHAVNLKEHNSLVSLSLDAGGTGVHGYVGVYQGRAKGRYMLKDPSKGVFVYIINGAFEVEERLMEYRDGLSLWNAASVDFESLSESGILLMMEMPLHTEH